MKHIHPAALPPVSKGGGPRKLTMVAGGVVPHLMQFARIVLPPGQAVAAHVHADWTEVYYVEAGEAIMTVEEVPVPLGVGQCLYIEPGERHGLRNDSSSDFAMVFFSIRS